MRVKVKGMYMELSKKEQREWAKAELGKLWEIREEGKWASYQIKKLEREMGPKELNGSSLSGEGGGGFQAPTIEQLNKLQELYDQLEEYKQRSIELELQTLRIIDKIDDGILRVILKRVYISGQRLRHMYKSITKSYDTVKQWHSEALVQFYVKSHEISPTNTPKYT